MCGEQVRETIDQASCAACRYGPLSREWNDTKQGGGGDLLGCVCVCANGGYMDMSVRAHFVH